MVLTELATSTFFRRVFGNMAAAGMGAEDEDDGDSLDSDSDDLLIGGADNDDEVGR